MFAMYSPLQPVSLLFVSLFRTLYQTRRYNLLEHRTTRRSVLRLIVWSHGADFTSELG